MEIKRRDFLRVMGAAAAGATVGGLFRTLTPKEARAAVYATNKKRWIFLVDTHKCVGCGMCVRACKLENEVPYNDPVTRTWVERYVILKSGKAIQDTPMGGLNGYTADDPQGQKINSDDIAKAFFVPKLCNQCEKPPCVQVCPVGATFQTADGVVLVDRTWCIGCGYCIMACPYGARFFHPIYHTAEKCTFCYHRISKGLQPACVFACPFGARNIGDKKDPNDPVTKIVLTERVSVLKSEYGTSPQVFYLGLDENVR